MTPLRKTNNKLRKKDITSLPKKIDFDNFMNKRDFLRACCFGGVLSSFSLVSLIKKKEYPKIGYVSIQNLPDGTRAGDWLVWDTKLNKPVAITDSDYEGITEANDKTGLIIGSWYDKPGMKLHHFKEYRDNFRIKYCGKNPNYLIYA